MFKKLFRLLMTLLILGVLVWFLAPRVFDGAANSLINSTVSQAQGLAQFIPAGVNTLSNAKGELQINLTGLTPDTAYQITLDQAQCGGNSTDLGQAMSDGSGNLYEEIPVNSLNTGQTWYVDVLQSGLSVACGLLQTDQNAGTQVISAAQSGPDVFGPQSTQDAQDQASTPTPATTPAANSNANNKPTHLPSLPNTGVGSGNSQQYDNNQYPRKY